MYIFLLYCNASAFVTCAIKNYLYYLYLLTCISLGLSMVICTSVRSKLIVVQVYMSVHVSVCIRLNR